LFYQQASSFQGIINLLSLNITLEPLSSIVIKQAMKKHKIFIVCIVLYIQAFSQYDSASHRSIIIKINPGLMFSTAFCPGELGGTVQVALNDTYSIFIGGGYNTKIPSYYPDSNPSTYSLNNSHGYTLRTGIYRFLKRNKNLSFQFFYRKWANTTVFDFYKNDQDWVDAFTSDISISPLTSIGIIIPTLTSSYFINRCYLSVYSFEFTYGKQELFGTNEHFLFEWYAGVGVRLKDIQVEELGSVDKTEKIYTPLVQPSYFTVNVIVPSVKLGVTVEYRF
jgi:hypothetical protein